MNDDLKSYAIFLNGGCLVAICLTKSIAENYAKCVYPEGSYRLKRASQRDFDELQGKG